MSVKEKLKHIIRRPTFLYHLRFQLLSKFETKESVSELYYNVLNPISEIPQYFFEINNKIFANQTNELNDLEKAETIARWMINNIKRGRGLGLPSEDTIKIMTLEKGGVCSDFAQVFNNLCVINNIKVKEWGFKSISKNKHIRGGHSFNEFYCKNLGKWILIDTYKCIFFYKKDSNIPLSVFELFDTLKENGKVIFKNIEPTYLTDPIRVKDVYLSSNSVPFLITNYHNKTYDCYLKKFNFLPVFFTHGIVYLLGKSYKFLFIREIYFQSKTE
ncbi:transglutaminase-like domain-containing protein [Flavobacterium wongokense]|uniref:transglutaminase-like domain-containing protein n=1 Tax=Flavobacterium wongokense TaxID=2910674 RepID=UPI001F43A943|nr:transglutaminase-like domain-containing protein [Flavobacterium sp. WG47]MCF6133282.1 transglutaminase-like domain-containing protein [Flavobacterium sp. WG47]